MTVTINGGKVIAATLPANTPVISGSTQGAMTIYQYRITPANAGAATVHGAITLPASGTTVVTTAITNPDFPRTLSVTGNALLIAGNVVIAGTDIAGNALTETIALNGLTKVVGTKAFATVTSITVPARNAGGDTVTIGTENVFGLPHALYNTTYLIKQLFNGAADVGTLALGGLLNSSLYTLAGTPNGSKVLAFVYMV